MNRLFTALAFATLALMAPAHAQNSPIAGVWKHTGQFRTEVSTGKGTYPYGEKPTGHIVFTKAGRVVAVLFGEGRKKPELPMSDADKVKLFDTLSAAMGTYKVDGNKLTVSYEHSWHELWPGTTQDRFFEIKGNTLTITSAPVKTASGIEVTFTITLEKVE